MIDAATEFSTVSSDIAQLIVQWSLDISRGKLDQAQAVKDYFPLKKKLDVAFAKNSKLGLHLETLVTGFQDGVNTLPEGPLDWKEWRGGDGDDRLLQGGDGTRDLPNPSS